MSRKPNHCSSKSQIDYKHVQKQYCGFLFMIGEEHRIQISLDLY